MELLVLARSGCAVGRMTIGLLLAHGMVELCLKPLLVHVRADGESLSLASEEEAWFSGITLRQVHGRSIGADARAGHDDHCLRGAENDRHFSNRTPRGWILAGTEFRWTQ